MSTWTFSAMTISVSMILYAIEDRNNMLYIAAKTIQHHVINSNDCYNTVHSACEYVKAT